MLLRKNSRTIKKWLAEFSQNPSMALDDWEPFCQSADPEGVRVITEYVDIPPRLPRLLSKARQQIRAAVPGERSLQNPSAPFNGPRYYLRSVVPEVRRHGERPTCILQFGPSDYRTFLVTNGMNRHWARLAGLSREWKNPVQWARRWSGANGKEHFFENSFGVNVLVTCKEGVSRYALFCERAGRVAVNADMTVGSADEGLRRRFGANLFDEKSKKDPAPDIKKAVLRALQEEVGIDKTRFAGSKPVVVSVGRVRSLSQPAALVHWPLSVPKNEIQHCIELAQDRHLEIREPHFVPFTRDGLVHFVSRQIEAGAPVASWVIAMALYSLGRSGAKSSKVFICYSQKDRQFVRPLMKDIRGHGIDVWIDEVEIRVGESLIDKIASGLAEVDFLVAVLSRASVRSQWCREELRMIMRRQIAEGKCRTLPVLKEDCDIPLYLQPRLFADLRRGKNRERGIKALVEAIRNL